MSHFQCLLGFLLFWYWQTSYYNHVCLIHTGLKTGKPLKSVRPDSLLATYFRKGGTLILDCELLLLCYLLIVYRIPYNGRLNNWVS